MEGTTMNRALSRTILGLLVVGASVIVPGGAAQPPGTSRSGAAGPQAVEVPVQCLLVKNLGTCVTCGMEASGAPGNVCSAFCKTVPPPQP
jgi:hypothetical protein